MLPSSSPVKPLGKVWVHSFYYSRLGRKPIRRKVTILTLDLALTSLVTFKGFFNSLKRYLLRAFDCRLAHLARAILYRELAGGGGIFTLPSAAHSAGDPSTARVKIGSSPGNVSAPRSPYIISWTHRCSMLTQGPHIGTLARLCSTYPSINT